MFLPKKKGFIKIIVFDHSFYFSIKFYKNIVNSIYIILVKFNLSFIKNKNSFIIINKLKNK